MQKVGSFTAWEMKSESSLDTSEMYQRLVGRGHHGNSFLFIKIFRYVFLRPDIHGRLLAKYTVRGYLKPMAFQRDDR